MGCIYQARCRVNGKRYVGKTVFMMEDRKREHRKNARNGSRHAFHRALRKHGFDAFEWKVLTEEDDPDELNDAERVHIRLLKTKAPNGYNLTDGGEGTSGWEPTEETKTKISEATKGRVAWNKGKPGKKGTVPWNKGKPGKKHTEASKELIRQGHLGKFVSTETRARISRAKTGVPSGFKGKHHTPETVEQNRRSHLGKKHSPEQAIKNRKMAKKRKRDELGRFLPGSIEGY